MSSIKDKVTKIIADKLVIDETEITDTANFKKDLGADSIDLVELIMEFEREFDLSIPDEKAEEIQTVGDAIGFLEANIEG
jgi:acyl carrier protein